MHIKRKNTWIIKFVLPQVCVRSPLQFSHSACLDLHSFPGEPCPALQPEPGPSLSVLVGHTRPQNHWVQWSPGDDFSGLVTNAIVFCINQGG